MNKAKIIITAFLLCFSFVNADDIINEYRLHGEAAVIQALEEQLQSQAYWMDYLGNQTIEYGYSERPIDLLVCDKSKKNMAIITRAHGIVNIDTVLPVITGENNGAKHREGDLKTPTGTYRLIEKKERVDSFYGPLALVTSYPNLYDDLMGKTGYGIWVHGMPLDDAEREQFTKGCIALENDALVHLANSIDYENTLLIISENEIDKTNREEIALVLANLYQWRDAWKRSDLNTYIDFYADDFIRFDGKSLAQFKKMKQRIFQKGGNKTILFSDFEIMLYPTMLGDKVFVVSFLEDYRAANISFLGRKELYLRIVGDHIKILAEK